MLACLQGLCDSTVVKEWCVAQGCGSKGALLEKLTDSLAKLRQS